MMIGLGGAARWGGMNPRAVADGCLLWISPGLLVLQGQRFGTMWGKQDYGMEGILHDQIDGKINPAH
jgi:hypothetical protein